MPSEATINYSRRRLGNALRGEDHDQLQLKTTGQCSQRRRSNIRRRSITAEDDRAEPSEAKINYSRRSITAEDDWAMLSEAKIIHKAKINYSRRRQGNALRGEDQLQPGEDQLQPGEDQLQPKTTGQCPQRRRSYIRRRSITAEDDWAMPSEAKINYSQAKINYSRRRLGNALRGEDQLQPKINYSRRRLGNALRGEDHILRVTELL
ncbi:hypothetical protein BKA56DRAFT_623898 [Ilyonectria sp. MPI-CAGE-AT-0026]|nr:hypothetical protein BKA56DRAFT_623898 [Ilyonectria sp. MPI-CAGE-AT-0026]